MLSWAARDAGSADHGDREAEIAMSGRELQRQLLEATFTIDAGCEERVEQVTSAAGIRHGTVEKGHDRGVISIFGPVRATRMAYRNRREANLYPADARWMLPDDPYSLGMRALVAYHLAEGGYGQAQDVIRARTGAKVGPAQLAQIAAELAAWTGDFYEQRAAGAETGLPASDVIMMQADGKGIATLPEYRKSSGETDAAIRDQEDGRGHRGRRLHPRRPRARGHRRPAGPPQSPSRPRARDKWVAASITDDIPAMIGKAYDHADLRDPLRVRQRVFLVDGNKQQITAIGDHARTRGSRCRCSSTSSTSPATWAKPLPRCTPATRRPPANGPTGKNSGSCTAAPEPSPPPWTSVAARARAKNSRLDLADVDKAVTYLANNHMHMRYDKALANGWPIATGMIEGACRFVIEDRFGITGARWSPDGAEAILKLRAVVINGDLDNYMNYYKNRYRNEKHLTRYDPESIPALGLAA